MININDNDIARIIKYYKQHPVKYTLGLDQWDGIQTTRMKDKGDITANDYRHARKQLKRFAETRRGGSYVTRGIASRWARINANKSTVMIMGGIIMDISKWSDGRNMTKHASTMHKTAHKIKVNALKPIGRMGDK